LLARRIGKIRISNLHLSNKEKPVDAHKPVEATAIKQAQRSSKQHGNRLLSLRWSPCGARAFVCAAAAIAMKTAMSASAIIFKEFLIAMSAGILAIGWIHAN
jgi:hypothetical protein